MDELESGCSPREAPSTPTTNSANTNILLGESHYFNCGRDQLKVDVFDQNDTGQNCLKRHIEAYGKGRSGAVMHLPGIAMVGLAGAFCACMIM
jgi:hypothetical protein